MTRRVPATYRRTALADRLLRGVAGTIVSAVVVGACAGAPPPVVTPTRPSLTFDEKMAWILRLEEDRRLAQPAPEFPPAPVVAPTRGGRQSATAPPPPPPTPDLTALLNDAEARIRRRAALAVGRVGMGEGIAPLTTVLAGDKDPEVRQMAAFALGLIGRPPAADALTAALTDADPQVQGRAAEALGMLAHKPAVAAIAAMLAVHVKAGALNDIHPDDAGYPKAAATEAVRLGTYALVRLGAYDALASLLLDGSGLPISRWWPIAYAFQRVGDATALRLDSLDG